jgi:predicted TIM-barrel fold metal-dependent hydrolase
MVVIDADTHVDECEDTWEFLTEAEAKFAPVTVSASAPATAGGVNAERSRWWLVEGQLVPRAFHEGPGYPPRVARELQDVQVRLADMDRLGVDVQVLFSTFFIRYGNTAHPAAEAALTMAYNRWMAERCARTNGRLRWIAQVPLRDVNQAVDQLRWAKDHGAVGLFKRGYDLETPVTDSRFFPIYEEASTLDLAVCIHTGHPLPGREWDRGFPLMGAFLTLVTSRVLPRFAKLRFGFIESGASWIPYALSQLAMHQRSASIHERPQTFELTRDLFRENRLFVAMDPVDDIEYLVRLGCEDNLMIGTDYGHGDISANQHALDQVRGWVAEERISETVARKILETNPQVFYGL